MRSHRGVRLGPMVPARRALSRRSQACRDRNDRPRGSASNRSDRFGLCRSRRRGPLRGTGSIVSGVTPHQHEDGPGAGAHGPERDLTPLPDLVHGRPRAGPVRERRPSTSTCCHRATTHARPARTSKAGSATPGSASTRRLGDSWSPTTRLRRSTDGSAITRASRSATAPISTRRSPSTPSSGSSAMQPASTDGNSRPLRKRRVSGC